jgi:hypothetical protein
MDHLKCTVIDSSGLDAGGGGYTDTRIIINRFTERERRRKQYNIPLSRNLVFPPEATNYNVSKA